MMVPKQPSISSSSNKFETTEFSIQHLIKVWRVRQNWRQKMFTTSFPIPNLNDNNVAPWRHRLASLLESPQADIFVILLLVFDLALSVVELSSFMAPPLCESTGRKLGEAWYHWIEVSILGLLFLKSMLLVVGLGWSFFKKLGYVVDGVVVGVALVLEVVLKRVGGGLMVVVSLWRVVRAVESVFELSDEAIQAKIEDIVAEFDVLRAENRRILESIDEGI